MIQDMSSPKVPLDEVTKAADISDREHGDLLACLHATGLSKEHQKIIGRRFYSLEELRAAYGRCPDVQKRQLLLAPLLLLTADEDSQQDASANGRAAASLSCQLFEATTAQCSSETVAESAPEMQLFIKATPGISKDT